MPIDVIRAEDEVPVDVIRAEEEVLTDVIRAVKVLVIPLSLGRKEARINR